MAEGLQMERRMMYQNGVLNTPQPAAKRRNRWMDGPVPGSQPRNMPMDGPLPPQPAPPQPRQIDGPGGMRPSFANLYGPQIQRAEQRFPGFANNARQQWQQMRQQQGPGFWRQYMQPGAGAQQNFPGFLNLFQNMMGGQPPPRFMNYAQRRGWAPQRQPRNHPIDY